MSPRPARSHDQGTWISQLGRWRCRPARTAASSVVDTTTELLAGSTYQPVTEFGTEADRAFSTAIRPRKASSRCAERVGSGDAGAADAGTATPTLSRTPAAAASTRRWLRTSTDQVLSVQLHDPQS